MKKILVRSIALALVLVLACLGFASCAKKLSGTYEGSGFNPVALEFSGSSVTFYVKGGEPVDGIQAEYAITEKEDGSYTINFTIPEDAEVDSGLKAIVEAVTASDAIPFEENEDKITIAKIFSFTKK